MAEQQRVVALDRLGMSDLAQVGGKNASLGEMIRHLASAFVARASTLRDTDLGPELFLVQSQAAPDLAGVKDSVE